MKPWFPTLFLALSGLLVLSSCSGSAQPASAPESQPSEHRSFEGTLSTKLDQLEKGFWTDKSCDPALKKKKYEIAQALDAHHAEIQSVAANLPTTKRYRQVDLPPTKAREIVRPPNPRKGWLIDYSSWNDLYEIYVKIKDSSIDTKWVALDSSVRAIVMDDENRVRYATTFIGHDAEAPLLELLRLVRECAANPNCDRLDLPLDSQNFAMRHPALAYHLEIVLNSESFSKRRDAINELKLWSESTLKYFTFRPNGTVRRTSNNILTLPLDPGPFSPSIAQVASYIESLWSSDELKVKVQWTSANGSNPPIYSLILGDSFGGRSYVSWTEHSVHLYPNVRTRAIAHEIGHVLGFSDHYFTVWQPESCRYAVEYREDDIMSDDDNGSVLPDEWKELDRTYPFEASRDLARR